MLLEIEHVSKQYGNGGVAANDDISLSVSAGEVFGLLGPNGAGKTTLVNQVLGLVQPTSGRMLIDGIDVTARPAVARRACSYQPQSHAPVEGLRPREAIRLAGQLRGGDRKTVMRRADELLEALDVVPWRDSLRPLSGGVARLVAFAMAAVVPGRIVVLDEPTNDVDPLRRKLLWAQVRGLADAGAAVLLVTHNVLEAERCVDRLAVIDHGRVQATGTPAQLKGALDARLRLEIVFEAGEASPAIPPYLRRPLRTGNRLFTELDITDMNDAVAWAQRLQAEHIVTEFFLGPASLEDVYVRFVGIEERPREALLG